MVGPTVALISRIETPKLLSTSTMRALFALISSMSTFGLSPSSYFLRRSSVGFLYLVKGSSGSIGVLRISSTLTTSLPAFSSFFATSTVSLLSSSVVASFGVSDMGESAMIGVFSTGFIVVLLASS